MNTTSVTVKTTYKEKKKYEILLLTNRDWDNIGDHVIEVCDISLISAVMRNLNIENYEINSQKLYQENIC